MESIGKIQKPVMILTGGKDIVFKQPETGDLTQKLIEKNGNKDVARAHFPEVNHILQDAVSGSMLEYATLDNAISRAVIVSIKEWLIKTLKE